MGFSEDIVSFARAPRIGIFGFHWRAQEEARLPCFKGSTVRGTLGWAFKRAVCIRADGRCDLCSVRQTCSYSFETPSLAETPPFRQQRHPLHPYVLEPPLEEKGTHAPGERMTFRLILLGRALAYVPRVILAVERAGRAGLGRGRARFELEVVFKKDARGHSSVIYDGLSGRFIWDTAENHLEEFIRARRLQLKPQGSDRIALRFVTPTHARVRGDLQSELPFELLVRNALGRLWLLTLGHGDHPPVRGSEGLPADSRFDPRNVIERTRSVQTVRSALTWCDWERYSHRQRTKSAIGKIPWRNRIRTARGRVSRFPSSAHRRRILASGHRHHLRLGKVRDHTLRKRIGKREQERTIPTTPHPESSRDGWTAIRSLWIGIRFGSQADPKEEPSPHTGMGDRAHFSGKVSCKISPYGRVKRRCGRVCSTYNRDIRGIEQ